MYLQVFKNILIERNCRQADLARMAGVSRAAVCKWFKSKDGICNIETKTLFNLARGLGIPPELLLKKSEDLSYLSPRFLWDSLYPSMESFVFALSRGQLPAIARLVQVQGFHAATKIAGKKVIALFPRYKKYIKPVRRTALEVVWPLYRTKK